MEHLGSLRREYPDYSEADLNEIYQRFTSLIWRERWDDDELALRSYYRNGKPDLAVLAEGE